MFRLWILGNRFLLPMLGGVSDNTPLQKVETSSPKVKVELQQQEEAVPQARGEAGPLIYDALLLDNKDLKLLSEPDRQFLHRIMDDTTQTDYVPTSGEVDGLRRIVLEATARLKGMQMTDLVVSKFGGDEQAGVRQSLTALQGRVSEKDYQATLTQVLTLLDDHTELHGDLNRHELAQTALADLAQPWKISQGCKGTCGATTGQIALALDNPARYVRLLTALASPSGDASSIVEGLKRPDDVDLKGVDGSKRSSTVRVLSSSFMNLAFGGTYSDVSDKDTRTGKGSLDPDKFSTYFQAVVVMNLQTERGGYPGESELFNKFKEAIAQGPVPVGMKWGATEASGGHQVLVTGLDDRYAYMLNPWGEMNKMPVDEFKKHLQAFSLPERQIPLLPEMKIKLETNKDNYSELDQSRYLNQEERDKRVEVTKSVKMVAEQFPNFDQLDPGLQKRLLAVLIYAEVPRSLIVPFNSKDNGGNDNKLYALIESGKVDEALVSKLEGIIRDGDYPAIKGVIGYTAVDINEAIQEEWKAQLNGMPGFSQLDEDIQDTLRDVFSQSINISLTEASTLVQRMIESGKLDLEAAEDLKLECDRAVIGNKSAIEIKQAVLAQVEKMVQ